jgi:uncharacterized Zn-binding protein involved in type VI secretion
MPPAARVTDMHTCPMATPGTPPIPHVGGPIIPPCAVNVIIGFQPAARITDMCICVGPPDVIVKGSPTVTILGLNAARIGDTTAHGGVIVTGFPTVIIGEMAVVMAGVAGGGGGSGAGGPSSEAPELITSSAGIQKAEIQAATLRKGHAGQAAFVEICR